MKGLSVGTRARYARTDEVSPIALQAQQQVAAAQARLVGESTDALHHRAVDLRAAFGLDALGFVQRHQLLQQVFGGAWHAASRFRPFAPAGPCVFWAQGRRGWPPGA